MIRDLKVFIKRLVPRRVFALAQTYRNLSPRERTTLLTLQARRVLRLGKHRAPRMPAQVRSVLFVCHGNIIRSPMAAALLERYLSDAALERISVASAGLHAESGRGADPRALAVAREYGISLDGHRTQLLTEDLVARSNLILAMDYRNEAELLARYASARHKAVLLGEFGDAGHLQQVEISDPFTGETPDVRRSFEIIALCTRGLANALIMARESMAQLPLTASPPCD